MCIYALVRVHCSFVLVVSFVATANITSPQKTISIPRGANLILPTHLTFESSGSCGLKPIVNAARLQFSPMMNQSNPTTLVLCEPSCTVLPDGITYNFSAFGNITITNAYEGYYMMGMQRPCPSPSYIIAATYTVTYSSPGKICCTPCIYHTVYCYGLSPLKTIYKDFVHFHFQFEVDFTFNDIKVKNVGKITSIQKSIVL